MEEAFESVMQRFDDDSKARFEQICSLVRSVSCDTAQASLWAKLPSYYVGDRFVRIIPFKDHFNIEASAVGSHADELAGYKITPKGMLQIFAKQPIPLEALSAVIRESLFD